MDTNFLPLLSGRDAEISSALLITDHQPSPRLRLGKLITLGIRVSALESGEPSVTG